MYRKQQEWPVAICLPLESAVMFRGDIVDDMIPRAWSANLRVCIEDAIGLTESKDHHSKVA